MKKNLLSPIKEILKDAKKGKMFILVDDKDRENEGDLIIPASKCNSRSINFMAIHGRGLICLALEKNQVVKLSLPLMSSVNKARMQTAFTVSIEAKKGITTGISAFDRAKTIKVAINSKSKKKDIVSPGHVFPLVARNGGVLERAGHTEASVDISRLAKLNPSAVICEVMNEDGRMARLNDLLKFSQKHKLRIASIEDLISYRLKNEKLIINTNNKVSEIKNHGSFQIKTYKNKLDKFDHYVICKGNFPIKKPVRVRVISIKIINNKINFNNDILMNSLKYLSKFNNFALILIRNKNLNNSKNESLNPKSSNTLRYYGIGAQIIKDLKIKNMILVTRSKKKIIGLEGFGIKIAKQEIIK
ncbi:MAG: 3,4-dihydroxy 2-butanone 4-phosphate synthase / GTP cyclohydrolase II [Pelagibacterales bacterium]|jgi:3,4-dihydroxy 2-butanone 4-phosphate synthase/GTP cyclohydrolase II|nr:3,4-dihydroxy 2-butanone 4-phosphate synthase / GTP cyclohydrolase II [Pelagibacterales bacterium]